MGAVISEDVKIEIRNQTDPTWGDSSCGVSSENGQIEGLKNGSVQAKMEKWKYGRMETATKARRKRRYNQPRAAPWDMEHPLRFPRPVRATTLKLKG